MRYTKILLLGMSALALAFGTAGAGLNPQNPGIGGTGFNSGASRACLACHTRIPLANAPNGTHFVTSGATTSDTRSGGGWNAAAPSIIREGGQYFRIGQWANPTAGRNAPFSKYGRATDNVSLIFGAPSDNTGMATQMATAATFGGYEIICESCHNVVSNVGGGNNLVAVLSGAYVAGGGNTTQAVPWSNSDEATICVGCHGFMYAVNATNQPRYADTRNQGEVTAGNRGNNHVHYIDGTLYPQNHHVMTADLINQTIAGVGLYWADTLVKDLSNAGWGATGSAVSTTYTAGTRGTMPMLATWNTDGGKVKSTNAAQINCIHCHSAPHAGDITTGASILRDTNAGGTGTGVTPISRIGDQGRTWMGFDDFAYCQDCHRLR